MVGTSSCHVFSLFFPALLLLLLLLLLPSSPLNSNRFPQVFTSFSPFRRDGTDHTTSSSPSCVSLDGVLPTSVSKTSKLNAAIIKLELAFRNEFGEVPSSSNDEVIVRGHNLAV